MRRRDFLKAAGLTGVSLTASPNIFGATLNFNDIEFSSAIYERNSAQTIIVFLYGGASGLGANLTNIDEITAASSGNYDYFEGRLHLTSNKFWQEAGGASLEQMITDGSANVFRTCYSAIREADGNKSHGRCVSQNQRGVMNDEDSAGIISVIAQTLFEKGVVDADTKLPFISMEGDSQLFTAPNLTLESFLRPTALSSELDNPYTRRYENRWYYYTRAEREVSQYQDNRADLDISMDTLAHSVNQMGKIQDAFDKRVELSNFIDDIDNKELPEGVEYPNGDFAKKMESAVKILTANPDTKIISLGSSGLGSWDDHNEARDYPIRKESLMSVINAALTHIKSEGKSGSINIVVWGDFGRNVNLNNSQGWDHGNTQNFYTFGGLDYFNHVGVVGETYLEETGAINRLFLKPKSTSYWFEPASIASTLYSIYGITNPKIITGGLEAIGSGLLK